MADTNSCKAKTQTSNPLLRLFGCLSCSHAKTTESGNEIWYQNRLKPG